MLQRASDPGWIELALGQLDRVLLDHAHCEKKAASQALSLIAAWPDRAALVQRLSRLAQEELTHFRQVYDRLLARGLTLGRDPGDPYPRALRRLVRPQPEGDRLTDLLLIAALIEARSHERLALLAAHLPDAELGGFYRTLARAEEGHARLFVDLAAEYAPRAAVEARLSELAREEARIVGELPLRPAIH